jgi:arabinofuranosyltransferase
MRQAPLYWSIVLLATAMAFAHAWSLAWTCDDAYISFRYAKNLVDGHGLVFNLDPSEAPVEGYTNFTWTMWLAVGQTLGFDGDWLESWSVFWGCLLHAATVFVLGLAAWRGSRGAAVVPIAAPAYAACYAGASLAPAGLETALFVLLGLLMWLLAVERRSARNLWLLGCLGALVAMTRPDGALFVAAAGAVVLFDAVALRNARGLWAFAIPVVVCVGPYLLWRKAYYGHLVPNTFFAKSGGDPNLAQGWFFVAEYMKCYALALAPAAVALLALPFRRGRLADPDPWTGPRAGMAAWLFVLPYVAFVVWVGGDFMFGRFMLPVTPLLLLSLDLLPWRPVLRLSAMGVALFGMLFRHDPPYLMDYSGAVSDNRAISIVEVAPGLPLTEYARLAGHEMRRLFGGLDVRIGIAGGHANFAFRSEVPVAVECAAGLTDAHIARIPVKSRGKSGHERPWTMYPDYLIERKLHFMLEGSYATGGVCDQWRALAMPVPGLPDALAMPVRIVIWDRELMAELRRRQPRLMGSDFEGALDLYIAKMPQMQQAEIARDYVDFRRFYFDHNDDAARQAAFEAALK